jgi:2,3-diketo-5-methylthio-1-phosphopentane phosphatase
MSEAAQHPRFERGGAPISVLVDFDGTISLTDVGDALLSRLVSDQDEVRRMDRLYVEGRKGSRELIAWDLDVLPSDPGLLLREVEQVALDESLVELVRVVRGLGGAVEVVSDGLGFHVEPLLDRLGLSDLPVATNASELGLGGAGVRFPYGHPACHVCGTCKRERVRLHQAAGRAVVFVGDGPSDRYAANHADVVFAKASLAAWCEAQRVPFQPWERLSNVAEWLTQALRDRRLPADAADFAAWAVLARPTAARFICGPEVWGKDRTMPAQGPVGSAEAAPLPEAP